jgi:hypothetical protein
MYRPHQRGMRLQIATTVKGQYESSDRTATTCTAAERFLAALVSNDASMKVLDRLRNGETKTILKNLDNLRSNTSALGNGIMTFTRFSDYQAIGGSLRQARCIESPPLSTVSFSDTHQSSSRPHNSYEGAAFPVWGSGGITDLSARRKLWPYTIYTRHCTYSSSTMGHVDDIVNLARHAYAKNGKGCKGGMIDKLSGLLARGCECGGTVS